MAEPKSKIFYINLGGSIGNIGAVRYAWKGKPKSYDEIGDGLGVVKAADTDDGLMFGCNSPKPAKVNVHYTDNSGNSKSVTRFCEPDKLGDVTVGGSLNGKKIWVGSTQYAITAVSIKSN